GPGKRHPAETPPPPPPHNKTRGTPPRQYLLPRYPITLRKHGAQALVPINNITKRSFQSQNVQLSAQPYRQRDRVVRSPSFQPIQKPQPKLRIRQRQFRRPLKRSQRGTHSIPSHPPLHTPANHHILP